MKLSNQIITSFSGVILLLLFIGFTSQYLNNRIKDRVIAEKEETVFKIRLVGEMESYLYQSLINLQYYLDRPYRASLSSDFSNQGLSLEKIKKNVRTSLRSFNENLQQLEKVLGEESYMHVALQSDTSASINAVALLKERVNYYSSLVDQLFSYDIDSGEKAQEFFTITVKPFFRHNIMPLFAKTKTQIRANLTAQVSSLNSRLSTYGNIILLATVVAFLLSLLLAYLLYNSITERVKLLANTAHDIGRGNLDRRIGIKTDDEIGRLGSSLNKMAKNLSNITFSKEFVDNIIESIGDGLIVTDKDTNIQKINSSTVELLTYEADQLIGKPLSPILTQKDSTMLLSLKNYTRLENYETQFIKKTGERFPVSLSKALLHKLDGDVQGMVWVFSDITERKKYEREILNSLKEKEILLAEIHHRVKNNLAVISGLLQMQIWETKNPAAEQALEDSRSRVNSIALVHEKLYQSENLSNIAFDKYVDELLVEIRNTYQQADTNIEFEIDITPIALSITQAISCALLINELIVNIYKHAFKNRDRGIIQIKLDEKDDFIHLLIKDDGHGLGEKFKLDSNKSMGMTIVNTLVQQLKGDINVYSDNGAAFEITFKLET